MIKTLWHLAVSIPQVLFCIVVLTPTITCVPSICKPSWVYSPPSFMCIKHFKTKKSWYKAKNTCENNDAQLVSIRDKKTNDFLKDYTMDGSVWIGLTDLDQEGHFKWLSSPQEPTYFNWSRGEPNGNEHENCVRMYTRLENNQTSWIDGGCNDKVFFICEMKGECEEETYGENCNLSCSSNCKIAENGSWCDRFSGQCFEGCTPGYQGSQCVEVCTRGTFGEGCERSCSLNCNATGQLCDHENGTCLHGCKPGFSGSKCLDLNKNREGLLSLHQIQIYMLGLLGVLLAAALLLLFVGQNELFQGDESFMSAEQLRKTSTEFYFETEDDCTEDFEKLSDNATRLELVEKVESEAVAFYQSYSSLRF